MSTRRSVAHGPVAAFVLHQYDWSETSLIVEFFTRERGRMVAAAKGAKVPAYVIFADATLEAVAAAKPLTRPALLRLSGIGPVKVERYGDALLEIVREHHAT